MWSTLWVPNYFMVLLKSYAICLYFYTSKSQGVISSKMKTHFSSIVSSNISKNRIYYRQRLFWEIFFKFFLKSWPIDLKGKVLLEKWNFLLALNQQQLKRRPTKTWKSSCRVLLVEIKKTVSTFQQKKIGKVLNYFFQIGFTLENMSFSKGGHRCTTRTTQSTSELGQ